MVNDKHFYCVGLYEELMCTTQNGVVLLIVTKKKKILVIPLLRTERETECNIVVKGKYTAELLRDVIFLLFFLYMLYILQIIQLEVE